MAAVTTWLIGLVSAGGIPAIFVTMAGESCGLPISSEIVVPLGGYFAAQGKLNFFLVVAASSLGNLLGSLIAYYLTRRFGEPFVKSRAGKLLGLSRGHLRMSENFFKRFGVWAVFFGRLLPIVRTYISFPAGLSKVRPLTFIVATTLGAIPWNFGLAFAGYKLGQHWEEVGKYLGPIGIPLAILVVIVVGFGWWYGRRYEEKLVAEEQAAATRI